MIPTLPDAFLALITFVGVSLILLFIFLTALKKLRPDIFFSLMDCTRYWRVDVFYWTFRWFLILLTIPTTVLAIVCAINFKSFEDKRLGHHLQEAPSLVFYALVASTLGIIAALNVIAILDKTRDEWRA